MASRGGPMVKGSDGRDFGHREQVANHYKQSAVNKSRFKFTAFLHILLAILMLFRLSVSIFVMCGMRPPSMLQKLRFPKAQAWEYVWLFSIVASIFGLFSIKRNRSFLMQQFLIGVIVFGLGPVCYAIYDMWDDTMSYIETREAKKLFLGKPVVILWNMFLIIALQVHFFAIMFAWNLLKAWTAAAQKKKL